MAKDQKKSREFDRDLDRIISGNKTGERTSPADSELNPELDFAQKLAGARNKPTPAFQSALKARLLSKLGETESARTSGSRFSFGEWVAGLFRQRTWQIAGTAIAVCVLTLLVVWRAGLFSQNPVVTTPYPQVAVEARAVLDKESYTTGEGVVIDFSFVNKSDDKLSFDMPPLFRIETLNADNIRTFPAGTDMVTLTPGQSASYTFTWDQTDSSGLQVPAGEFQLVMPNVNLGEDGFISLMQSPLIVITANN